MMQSRVTTRRRSEKTSTSPTLPWSNQQTIFPYKDHGDYASVYATLARTASRSYFMSEKSHIMLQASSHFLP